ncbi:MAG: choice-of-anchor D domain-containing protein [Muribaculaceae bacterium]|nr:choice-of-anchor D domain-containing protein [Muribaculaceae bacterium]
MTISAPQGDNVFTFTPALPLEVAAGTNATVSVVYNPAAGGEHTATISVGEKTVTLNGKASEVSIDVTPAELTFGGESFIQGNTETKQVTITNNTPNSLTTALAVAGDGAAMFTVGENTTIASGQTGTVNVTYNPAAAGAHTATLTVVEGKTVALTGTSIAQVISGTVTPESLSLTCAEGKTATDKITVANTGNMVFTPVFNIQSADADVPFSIVEATEIAAGASKEFTVTYAPDFVGEHTATLTVTINGEETTVALNGTATEGPKEVTVADGSATSSCLPVYGLYYDESTQSNQMIYTSEMLGKRMIGKRITSMTFYSNTATYFSEGKVTFSLANLPVETSAFTSAARLEPDGLTQVHSEAAPGGTRSEWTLTFPDNVYFIYNGENLLIDVVTEHGTFKSVSFYGEDGHANASWYSYSGSNNTLTDFLPKIMFTFEDAAPEVTVSPSELTFGGDNFVFGSPETKTFKVTNTTTQSVDLTLNDKNNVYTIEPTTIEAGAINEVVTVTYAPTAAGEHSATVTAGDKTVTLTGKAVAPVISGNVTPSEVTLEANVDGEGTQTITIENTGNTVFTPVFSGIEAPFSIEEAKEIPVGESKNFSIKYNPTEFNTHEGKLSVTIGENTTDVTLNGIAYQALDDVTVADGEDEGYIVPFYGYYTSVQGAYGQMIYPAADLENMKGKSITAIKFYSSTGIKFSGAIFDVTIGTTDQDAFSDTKRVAIDGGIKASVSPAEDDDVIEIKFSQPFMYVGGNLIVDTYLIEKTTYQLADPSNGATKYSGKTQTATTAINSAAGGCSAQFLPKITFSLAESAAGITFAELCENGKKDNVYTITDELTSVYQNGTSVWFKDNNNSIVKDVPAEGDKDFEVEGVSQMDFDQSNWIEVVFADEETAEKFTLQPKKVVGITGTYVDNVNPTLVVSNGVKYSEAKAEAYTPNPYIPANFLGSQDCQSGQNHGHFFFAKPKVQEYATIMYAMYDGNNIMKMYASGPGNGHMFQGQFTIDMSQNETQNVELKEGVVYSNFKAIIRKVSTQNAPGLKAEGEGGYVVYPQDLKVNNALPTAINGIVYGKDVKSVKYVNVAGMVSDRPFQGVNIVVTEFTDGSSTTTKVVR